MGLKIRVFEELIRAQGCPGYYRKFQVEIDRASELFDGGRIVECSEVLDELPNEETLRGELLEKLKGKHLYRTLEQIAQDKVHDRFVVLKAMSSLLTHIAIECEQGCTEYETLIPQVLERINGLAFPSRTPRICR